MGVDLRSGRKDHYIRYKIYGINTKSKDVLENHLDAVGILYGKDITPSAFNKKQFGNVAQSNSHEITIETLDRIELVPNQLLRSSADNEFYLVKNITEETVNSNQQLSRRPKIVRTITLRKA